MSYLQYVASCLHNDASKPRRETRSLSHPVEGRIVQWPKAQGLGFSVAFTDTVVISEPTAIAATNGSEMVILKGFRISSGLPLCLRARSSSSRASITCRRQGSIFPAVSKMALENLMQFASRDAVSMHPSEIVQIAKRIHNLQLAGAKADRCRLTETMLPMISLYVDQYLTSSRPGHICAILNALALCDVQNFEPATTKRLLDKLTESVHLTTPKQLSSSLAAMVRLQNCHKQAIQVCSEAALSKLSNLGPSDLILILKSISQSKVPVSPKLIGSAADRISSHIDTISIRGLISLLFAFTVSKWPAQDLIAAVEPRITCLSHTSVAGHQIATMTWILAKQGCRHADPYHRLSSIALYTRLAGFDEEALCKTLWSFAVAQVRCTRLATEIVHELAELPISTSSIALAIWSVAKLKMYHLVEDAFNAFRDRIVNEIDGFSGGDLKRLRWAFASAGITDGTLCETIFSRSFQLCQQRDVESLASLMRGLSITGQCISLLSKSASSILESGMEKCKDNDIAAMAWSLSVALQGDHKFFDHVINFIGPHFCRDLYPILMWSFACVQRVLPIDCLAVLCSENVTLSTSQKCQIHQWRLASKIVASSDAHQALLSACEREMRNVSSRAKAYPIHRHIMRYLPTKFESNVICSKTSLQLNFASASESIVLEVVDSHDFIRCYESRVLNGATRFKTRLLEQHGWRVVYVDAATWHQLKSKNDRTHYIDSVLANQDSFNR